MKSPLPRLLRANISPAQLAGYALANLVGLSIIIVALQFFLDIRSVYTGSDSFVSDDYMVISKRVSGLGGLTGASSSTFSADEVALLAAEPWAAEVGAFEPARFNVAATVDMGGHAMSTQLFLEAIPDSFLDVVPQGWEFSPNGSREIPVIISKDYLTLYNFGFASSRGLPQISEELVGMVPLRLSVSGNGRQQWFDARVVGFSKRLNTIAVPQSFMQWANSTFADTPPSDPSRLIVKLDPPGSPDAEKFISDAGYETAGDKTASSRAAYFLTVLTAIIIAVGLVISCLAFVILVLSIYLLLQKNRRTLTDLMALGYTPADLSAIYRRLIIYINVAVTLGGIAILVTAGCLWRGALISLGATPSPLFPVIGVAVILMTLLTILTTLFISRNVRGAFRS